MAKSKKTIIGSVSGILVGLMAIFSAIDYFNNKLDEFAMTEDLVKLESKVNKSVNRFDIFIVEEKIKKIKREYPNDDAPIIVLETWSDLKLRLEALKLEYENLRKSTNK